MTDIPDKVRFFSELGVEVPAVTGEQMREIDRIATEETGPNLYQMMENAGRGLALLSLELLGSEWEKARIGRMGLGYISPFGNRCWTRLRSG